MKKWLVFLITYSTLFLLAANAKADEVFFKYGIGILLPKNYFAEVKGFAIGYQRPIWDVITHKGELGLWADPYSGRSSSGYAAYSVGVSVRPRYFYAESFWGIAGISHPDAQLSTNFEFIQNLGAGVRDRKGRFIGVEYQHLSNAGIQLPNYGRDFILIKVGVRLGE